MENSNTKQVIINLLTNNLIHGRVTTDPCGYKKELQVQMGFDDVMIGDDNVALLYDTDNDTRAELTGLFKLPLDLIEEAHFTEDFLGYEDLYGKYHVLVYLGKELDTEVLLTFRMKDSKMSPFILDNDEALEYAYASEAVNQLDYFLDKPVTMNLSSLSLFSSYDVDNCTYANPVFATIEIKSFQYEFKLIDGIPCVTITDKENRNIQLTLNAIGCVRECNVGDSVKRIFHLDSEIGLATIMDEGYIFPSKKGGGIVDNELRQEIAKIIELSKTSTLCANYSNDVISISFAITDELTLTEQSSEDSFSLWLSVEGLATPTEINLKYSDVKSAEFITEEEMSKRSNGESNMAALEIKLVNGSELTLFEDVA